MNTSAFIDLRDLLLQNLRTIYRATGCRHTSDEDLYTICLENLFDTAPVRDLHRCDGKSYRYGVKSKKTVTEHDWILGGPICNKLSLGRAERNVIACIFSCACAVLLLHLKRDLPHSGEHPHFACFRLGTTTSCSVSTESD